MIADGKLVSARLKEKIIDNLKDKPKKEVCFVIFGDDKASRQFIGMKCRFAETLGIPTRVIEHPEHLSFEEIKKIIEDIVTQDFAGIVIQLPLPSGLSTQDILDLVPSHLDIDVLGTKTKEDYKKGISNKVPPVSLSVFPTGR
jgi:methylenetetrahydrofolate dehydrogenase (NADP+)/methenyltetrahydrofolate cyclohydrolase